MNRFSVLYRFNEEYNHISIGTHAEADAILDQLCSAGEKTPVGIYDDKTELFQWVPCPRYGPEVRSVTPDEQDKIDNAMIEIAQQLRKEAEKQLFTKEQLPTDVLQRPVSLG